jgi:NTE family protein
MLVFPQAMTTAFVLSGGASLGSVQVGMALALKQAGVRPDRIVGTSVGAINGAWLAGGGEPEELQEIWHGLRRADLFPMRPLVGLKAFLGRRRNFAPNSGLRHLLERHARFARLEEAPLPLEVVATDALTGQEVALTEGPTVEAILASAALPGVYPPIELNGRLLIDGGVVNNTPITRAVESGATEVWVLSTGYSCGLARLPRGALEMALHAVGLLVQQRLDREVAAKDYRVPVHLIPPPCPIDVAPTDFSQTDQLIERAHNGTLHWLDSGMPEATPLSHLERHHRA